MSAPERKNPFPKTLMVRLDVRTEGDFFSVDCEICKQRLAAGLGVALGQALEDILRRVVTAHCHEV